MNSKKNFVEATVLIGLAIFAVTALAAFFDEADASSAAMSSCMATGSKDYECAFRVRGPNSRFTN